MISATLLWAVEEHRVDVVRKSFLADAPAELDAVDARHVPIGDEKVRAVAMRCFQSIATVDRLLHFVARCDKPVGDEPADRRIVVGNQDFSIQQFHRGPGDAKPKEVTRGVPQMPHGRPRQGADNSCVNGHIGRAVRQRLGRSLIGKYTLMRHAQESCKD